MPKPSCWTLERPSKKPRKGRIPEAEMLRLCFSLTNTAGRYKSAPGQDCDRCRTRGEDCLIPALIEVRISQRARPSNIRLYNRSACSGCDPSGRACSQGTSGSDRKDRFWSETDTQRHSYLTLVTVVDGPGGVILVPVTQYEEEEEANPRPPLENGMLEAMHSGSDDLSRMHGDQRDRLLKLHRSLEEAELRDEAEPLNEAEPLDEANCTEDPIPFRKPRSSVLEWVRITEASAISEDARAHPPTATFHASHPFRNASKSVADDEPRPPAQQ